MSITKADIEQYIESSSFLVKNTFVKSTSKKFMSRDYADSYITLVAEESSLDVATRVRSNSVEILAKFEFGEFKLILQIILDREFSKPDPFLVQLLKPLLFLGTRVLSGISFEGKSNQEQRDMTEALVWSGIFVILEKEEQEGR